MSETLRVHLVAAPLEGRSGVYRSTYDLVAAARAQGLPWTASIGMRPSAPARVSPVHPNVSEWVADAHGMGGVDQIVRTVSADPAFAIADVVITLITQSDIALARMNRREAQRWVAWVRGLPWPAPGESSLPKRIAQRVIETRALRQADDFWVTTAVLDASVRGVRDALIVPAGVPGATRTHFGALRSDMRAVWAGRLAIDKRPRLFADASRIAGIPGMVFGAGALEAELREAMPDGVELCGWVSADELWENAAMFVGTSSREAFGRSAVEAAIRGVPIVIGSAYGAAPLLVTDPALRREIVIDSDRPQDWAHAMRRVWDDPNLRAEVSDHVFHNARELTIEASVRHIVARLSATE